MQFINFLNVKNVWNHMECKKKVEVWIRVETVYTVITPMFSDTLCFRTPPIYTELIMF